MQSSGSDNEGSANYENRGKEKHSNADCKYNVFRTISKDGGEIYVCTRDCRCGKFKSYTVEGPVDLNPQDGKEIHMQKECKWRSSKSDPKILRRKCVCSGPTAASRIGDTNCPM